jgi:hypothetical protein
MNTQHYFLHVSSTHACIIAPSPQALLSQAQELANLLLLEEQQSSEEGPLRGSPHKEAPPSTPLLLSYDGGSSSSALQPPTIGGPLSLMPSNVIADEGARDGDGFMTPVPSPFGVSRG